jgi:hypothetical protein
VPIVLGKGCISVELRRKLRDQFGDCCAYCRSAAALIAINLEVEHIQPRVAGGLSSLDNLCLACPSCNRYKGSRQTAIDPESGEAVLLFHPQKQVWMEHFGWISDASQIAGKTAIGRATVEALQMNRSVLTSVRDKGSEEKTGLVKLRHSLTKPSTQPRHAQSRSSVLQNR